MVTHPDATRCTNRVAIVTGGSSGLGLEVTRKLARRGYAIVVTYALNQLAADAVVEEVLVAHGCALAIRADVADELDVERLFKETDEAFGGVDVVVHAARRAVIGPVAGPDVEAFDALHRANVRGTFIVNQQASRHLRAGGAIVNVFSCAVGLGHATSAAYAASKGAAEAITPVLAGELLRHDIRVNAVDAWLGSSGTPADIANIVAFLISARGRWINGQVIRANGGVTLNMTSVDVGSRT